MKDMIKSFFIKDEEKEEQVISEENAKKDVSDGNKEVETAKSYESSALEEGISVKEKPLSDYTLKELAFIREKNGTDEVICDLLSEEFEVFAEARGGGLEEKYEAFTRLKALMKPKEKKADDEVLSEKEGRLHSGFSGAVYRDASSGLTKRQMDMARSAGMSFREYEELLNAAPATRKNRF